MGEQEPIDLDALMAEIRERIRTKREKFIWRSDEANELYDLAADPDGSRANGTTQ